MAKVSTARTNSEEQYKRLESVQALRDKWVYALNELKITLLKILLVLKKKITALTDSG